VGLPEDGADYLRPAFARRCWKLCGGIFDRDQALGFGSPGILESTANAIAEVLLQPGIRFLSVGMPGELEWAIILGNSIVWGIGGAILVLAIGKGRRASAAV
jgi:hypothetical protein